MTGAGTGIGGEFGVSYPAAPDAGLTFAADHPGITDRANHRQPCRGLVVDTSKKRITVPEGGWIDGPVIVGRGWTICSQETSPPLSPLGSTGAAVERVG